MNIIAIVTTVAALFIFAGADAYAEPEPISVPVSFAGLDLSSHEGQAELDRRIQVAAEKACRMLERQRDLSINPEIGECAATAASNARIALASAQVLAPR